MKVLVIIPSYNSAPKIGRVISDLISYNYKNIVVVDDGSQDNTREILKNFEVTVLQHIINRGQGAALETGNQYALQQGADIVVHFDADGQMQAKDIDRMIDPIINDDFQVVLGSRYLSSSSRLPWLKRFIYFPIGKFINLVFTGLWLTDAHCGFRALSKAALSKISIKQDRMAHATEILERISLTKIKFREVPVDIKYENFGQGLTGINGALQTLKDLVKAKFFK